MFKAGDVVEIAFVCVGVPVREKRYRVLMTLRAVTLISDKFRKVNELLSLLRLDNFTEHYFHVGCGSQVACIKERGSGVREFHDQAPPFVCRHGRSSRNFVQATSGRVGGTGAKEGSGRQQS